MYGLVLKNVRIVRIFKKKIVRIVFRKLYGLYGFLLKMYGFLDGCFQKSFGHPVIILSFTFKLLIDALILQKSGIQMTQV